MNTKREILKWWCDRGKVIDGKRNGDWVDFWEKIEQDKFVIGIKEKKNFKEVELRKRGWKYNVFILFIDGELAKIVF
jgi:hypothetical protein